MEIANESPISISWFCYNNDDHLKIIALGSGNLDSRTSTTYEPKKNTDDEYCVRFTRPGGQGVLKEMTVSRHGMATYGD